MSKLTEGDSSQNHRKSTSLDNINLQQNGGLQQHHQQQQQQQPHWKSYSLQRGLAPPDSELLSLQQHHDEAAAIGLQALRSSSSAIGGNSASALVPQNDVGGATGEEDVYGRCTNMRLTSFTEAAAAAARDPRIIDLAQCTGVSMGNGSVGAASAVSSAAVNGGLHHPGGHSHHHHLPPMSAVGPPAAAAGYPAVSNFNTLPVHLSGGGGGGLGHHSAVGGGHHQPPLLHHQHNTLPARVGESPPRTGPHHSSATAAAAAAASGRHFKPFDHRRMNPMAEIQENPYELQVSPNISHEQKKLGSFTTLNIPFDIIFDVIVHMYCKI